MKFESMLEREGGGAEILKDLELYSSFLLHDVRIISNEMLKRH